MPFFFFPASGQELRVGFLGGNVDVLKLRKETVLLLGAEKVVSVVFENKIYKIFYISQKESRTLAEIAKAELDGTILKSRPLRIRFATHGAALTVKNLSPVVSNELLEQAFSQFGPVERAVVVVDDRGRATGKGFVEFAAKPPARKALERCSDGAFLLTT